MTDSGAVATVTVSCVLADRVDVATVVATKIQFQLNFDYVDV